jgi:site-specific DNA recombinase
MKAAAIYARISSDPSGSALGVSRQIEDCKTWAHSHGTVVAEVYIDNDVSAYSGKLRPAYRRMCDDIKQGIRDGLIAWHPDRLHRSQRELEDFIDLIEATQTEVHTVTGGDYDLSSPHGRLFARMLGAVARHESEDKSRRITRKAAELAQQGKRSGGGTRAYGYDAGHDKIAPKEATIVKEAAQRILAGDTLRSVCRDFNERKIPTVQGGAWSTTVLRNILMSARISGQREHRGEIVARGTWPAILTSSQTARLRSLLGNPDRRTNRSPRSYPLTGLVRCSLCGEKMVARPRDDGSRRYVCAKGPGNVGCGKTYQLAEPLEDLIAEAVFYRLDGEGLAHAIAARSSGESGTQDIEQALQDDRLRLDELADMYGRKEIVAREWTAARTPIQRRIAENERRLGALTGSSALDGYIGHADALRSQWDSLAPARQRAVVAALLDSIIIGPAVRGRNTFDPTRVTPVWKV